MYDHITEPMDIRVMQVVVIPPPGIRDVWLSAGTNRYRSDLIFCCLDQITHEIELNEQISVTFPINPHVNSGCHTSIIPVSLLNLRKRHQSASYMKTATMLIAPRKMQK
jgi:hypothetical protein